MLTHRQTHTQTDKTVTVPFCLRYAVRVIINIEAKITIIVTGNNAVITYIVNYNTIIIINTDILKVVWSSWC